MKCAWWLILAGCGGAAINTPAAPTHYAGPVIDVHAHMQLDPKEPPGTEKLLDLDRKAGVTHSGFIVMARQGDIAATRAQNDKLIALTVATGGALFPVASVHPMDGSDALDELTRLAGLGVKLIKLHPNTQKFDVAAPEVDAVVKRGAELGLVFLFDGFSPFDANESGKFLMLAVTNPKARIIIAHIGGPRFVEMTMFAMVKQFEWWPKNVWFDLSATSHTFTGSPFAEQLVWVTRQIGIDRIVFGSDYPVDTPEHAVQDVERLGYTAAEQRAIFHDNAAQLLGLD